MLAVLPNDWKRLAPISLPREQPVTQFVIDRAFAQAAFFKPLGYFSNRIARRQSVDDRRINRHPIADKSDWIFIARRLDNLPNRQIEFARKLQIALIVRRHGLNCTGAVAE